MQTHQHPGDVEAPLSPAPVPFEAARDRRRGTQLTRAFRRDDVLALMPDTAKFLIELIGLEATLKLAKAEGGNELRIPDVVGGKSAMWVRLVDLLGEHAAAIIVERCRHSAIYVPMCAAALRMERQIDILTRFDQGENFEDIRRRHNVSRSYLFRLLKKGGAGASADSTAAAPPVAAASSEQRGASSADSALAVAMSSEARP